MAEESLAPQVGVLVVSDSRNQATDESGPEIVKALARFGFDRASVRICRDEIELIKTNILDLGAHCAIVFTSGGTGFARRDVTPEATLQLIERQADSLSELIRSKGRESTPFSHLSRGVAGVRGNTLIVNLPGSPQGGRQGVEAIGHLLGPIVAALTGKPCPVGPNSVA